MLAKCIFHYVLALLEGGLSGVLLYEAEKEETQKRRLLLLFTSIGWFILSLADAFQGGDALRELREQKEYEVDGGDYDE